MLLAGVVDQHVEPPERVDDLLHRRLAEILVAKVAGDEDRALPLGLDDLLGLRGVVMFAKIEDGDVGALTRIEGGDRSADAAIGAGDDRDLALEPARSLVARFPFGFWG
jgi:hypothetical protein